MNAAAACAATTSCWALCSAISSSDVSRRSSGASAGTVSPSSYAISTTLPRSVTLISVQRSGSILLSRITTSSAMVTAGRDSCLPSDVIAGAVSGAAAGLVTPLHPAANIKMTAINAEGEFLCLSLHPPSIYLTLFGEVMLIDKANLNKFVCANKQLAQGDGNCRSTVV